MGKFIATYGVGLACFIVIATILMVGGIEYKQALPMALGASIAVALLGGKQV